MRHSKQVWITLSLTALLAFLMAACHKDPTPQPNPDHPTDPIIPTKEITIHWNWEANLGWAPPKDSIKYYTDKRDCIRLELGKALNVDTFKTRRRIRQPTRCKIY